MTNLLSSLLVILAILLFLPTQLMAKATSDEKVNVVDGKQALTMCNGMFCDLAGGAYFNAIYHNDYQLIKKLDASVNKSIERRFAAIAALSDRLGEEQQPFSMLPVIADTYLQQYGSHYAQACSENIIDKKVTKNNTYFGMSDRQAIAKKSNTSSQVFTYNINKNMDKLCDRVCDNTGGKAERFMVKNTGNINAMKTLASISDLMTGNACDSKQIKQFENNLRSLTNSYLDEYH